MSNVPTVENELPPDGERQAEQEQSWFERLLARFGLGEELELREIIEDALARAQGENDSIGAQERAMFLNILRFGKQSVEDVMIPRADIIAVEDKITVDELLRVFREAEHSRLPVYRESLDEPRGMIHIRDLMSWITSTAAAGPEPKLDLSAVDLSRSIADIDITREILYVPASMSLVDLLLKMQATRIHLALVVDEYGGTDGLVSIEDLVEEVVGEIEDEHDVAESWIREDPRQGLIANALAPIEELETYLGRKLVAPEQEEDIDTLGGLVFSLAGRIPVRGEIVPHPSGITFEVLEADRRRIKKLRIHPAKLASEAKAPGAPEAGGA
jgi:CBS domain containing-hemolysin-like protein